MVKLIERRLGSGTMWGVKVIENHKNVRVNLIES